MESAENNNIGNDLTKRVTVNIKLRNVFEEFVCKTRYIQQSSFEIISFLYLIVNAFDAKLNFSWVHHNGIQ